MKLKKSWLIVLTMIAAIFLLQSCPGPKKDDAKKDDVKKVDKKADAKPVKPGEEIFKVIVGDAVAMGEKDAPVTVINFSDFQCPFSKRSVDLMDKINKDYKGKVRYVFKHFPLGFHKQAKPAAKAAIAAQKQGKFWEFYKKAFSNIKEIKEENFEKWAKELGLDVEKFKKDMADPAVAKQLANDMKQGSQFGVRGTPTMFINGVRIVGANAPKIEKIIKAQIINGEKLKAKGDKDPYTTLVKNGKTKYTPPKRKPPKIPSDIYKIAIPKTSPMWGEKDAPVTMILFDDFQCPFCKRLHGTYKKIKKEFGGKVRIFYIQRPLKFHPNAPAAAWATIAAQKQGKFWEMYDKLFNEQKKWSRDKEIDKYLEKAGKEIGLDIAKFKKVYADPATKAIVDSDGKLADKLKVRGTPGTFVNGRFIGGAYPFESFKAVIEEELKRAKPLMDKGLKGDALYTELVKSGKTEVQSRRKNNKKKEDPNKVYKIGLHGKEPVIGKKNAPITIVEFSEHECPFCKRGAKTAKDIVAQYKGKVQLKFKHMPLGFHKKAKPAALFTIAVKKLYGDAKSFTASDKLFSNQKEWKSDTDKFFEKYSKEIGVDWAKVKAEMASPASQEILKKDMAEAAKHGVRGVPAFFINGKKLSGAQPAARFKAVIDEMLKKGGKK